jgi:hypothetical protein
MRTLLRLALLAGIAVWVWRYFVGRRQPPERASISYADGSSLVLEPGSPEFERLAAVARPVLGS